MVVSGEIKKKQTGATRVCVCVVYVYIYMDILLITVMDLLLFKTNYLSIVMNYSNNLLLNTGSNNLFLILIIKIY